MIETEEVDVAVPEGVLESIAELDEDAETEEEPVGDFVVESEPVLVTDTVLDFE